MVQIRHNQQNDIRDEEVEQPAHQIWVYVLIVEVEVGSVDAVCKMHV